MENLRLRRKWRKRNEKLPKNKVFMKFFLKFLFFALILLTLSCWLYIRIKFLGESLPYTLRFVAGFLIFPFIIAWLFWRFVFKKRPLFLLGGFSLLITLSVLGDMPHEVKKVEQSKMFLNARKKSTRDGQKWRGKVGDLNHRMEELNE
jgi:asparagine N-glycosylation enzyme membrane subunit Stt3